MRTKRGLAWLGVGVATVLWGGVAWADIETFYKTDVCPNFGGLKPPIAFEMGLMEAVQDNAADFGGIGFGGAGGQFCNLFSLPERSVPFGLKAFPVGNANVIVLTGDTVDPPGAPPDTWACVVCQYEDKVAAHPALSVLGTALLMGGLVTAMLYELRRRQSGGSA
jgi:hypothetical protein